MTVTRNQLPFTFRTAFYVATIMMHIAGAVDDIAIVAACVYVKILCIAFVFLPVDDDGRKGTTVGGFHFFFAIVALCHCFSSPILPRRGVSVYGTLKCSGFFLSIDTLILFGFLERGDTLKCSGFLAFLDTFRVHGFLSLCDTLQ